MIEILEGNLLGNIIAFISMLISLVTLLKTESIKDSVKRIMAQKKFSGFYNEKKEKLEKLIMQSQNNNIIAEAELKELGFLMMAFLELKTWNKEERSAIEDAVRCIDDALKRYNKLSDDRKRDVTVSVLIAVRDAYAKMMWKE